MDYNKISTVEPGTWLGINRLRYLELEHNELAVLTTGMFNHLPELKHLYLNDNKISTMESGAFSNLTSLTYLNLYYNSISVLRRDMFVDLSNLAELRIDRNILFWIEDGAFNGLHSLRKLDLENNRLNNSIFAPNVFMDVADTLTSLNLDYNRITRIYNDTFSNFTALQTFDISGLDIVERNGFRGINVLSDIADTLTTLRIYSSPIESLYEDMFGMIPQLKTLVINWCSIETIHPETFISLSNLESLQLRGNRISEEQIKNLQSLPSSLRYLNLNNNRIANIPTGTFEGFSIMGTLTLSVNQISVLISGGFYRLQSLRYLYLTGNVISTVEPGSFLGLSSLTFLSLQNNALTIVVENTFQGLTALNSLTLKGNRISEILPGGFHDLPSSTRINLNDNSLKTLEWTAFNPTCAAPPGKSNILLIFSGVGSMVTLTFGRKC